MARKRVVLRFQWLAFLLLFAMSAPAETRKPAVAFGLNGISDWSTQHPFIDIMKTARPWIGHLPNQWGGVSFEKALSNGWIDDEGWPKFIPPEVTKLEALLLTDQSEEAAHLRGRYRVLYDGNGEIERTGRGRTVEVTPNSLTFTYDPGPGSVGIAIKQSDPDNPIRNIRVVKEEHLDAFNSGATFNPDWLARLGTPPVLRFMDWMDTNNSGISKIEHLPRVADFTYGWRGVPLPTIISLSNQLDADPWITLPHLADDELVAHFANTVFASLEPERTVYVEYSNEVWNFLFEQARWAQRQADTRWNASGDAWVQYYALRAAQVMSIWTEVFGDSAPDRLKRVVSVHTGWPGLEEAMLKGSFVSRELGEAPSNFFDAYAVTGYLGFDLEDWDRVNELLEADEKKADGLGREQGLSRVALREFIRKNRFTGIHDEVAQIIRDGSMKSLSTELWPHHARAAKSAGLDLVMYEGGTHAAPTGEGLNDERLIAYLEAFNYSDEMGALYTDLLAAWNELTDQPFNAFVDVAAPSKWGSWGALRHLNDDNPRWRALGGAPPE